MAWSPRSTWFSETMPDVNTSDVSDDDAIAGDKFEGIESAMPPPRGVAVADNDDCRLPQNALELSTLCEGCGALALRKLRPRRPRPSVTEDGCSERRDDNERLC